MNNVNFQLSKDYLNKWMDKQLGFEYIVYKVLKEWSDEDSIKSLKSILIASFIITWKTSLNSQGDLINYPFDNIHAMAYGIVEKDILDKTKKKQFIFLKSEGQLLSLTSYSYLVSNALDKNLKEKIDNNFHDIKKAYPDLIQRSGFDMVEIFQQWFSWRVTWENYNEDKIKNNSRIKKKDIKLTTKVYTKFNDILPFWEI